MFSTQKDEAVGQGTSAGVEAGKEGKGTFLEASEGTQLCKHLEFIPGRHTSHFRPPERQCNKITLFEGTKFVVICSSAVGNSYGKGEYVCVRVRACDHRRICSP